MTTDTDTDTDTDTERTQKGAGSRDSTFGTNGFSQLPIAEASLVAMLPDQRIVISGMQFTQYQAVRLNSDGVLDVSFGNNGIAEGAYMEDRSPLASTLGLQVIDHDATILSSAITSHSINYLAVGLLNKAGQIHKPFGNNGVALIQASPDQAKAAHSSDSPDSPDSPDSSSSGAFVFPLSGANDSYLVKLTEEGALDVSFNKTGFRDIPPGAPGYAGDLAFTVQHKDNKIVYTYSKEVAGQREFTIGRLTATGEEDLSFAEQGYVTLLPATPGLESETTLNALITHPDDGIIALGVRSLNYFEKSMLIAKLTSEGDFDKEFNEGEPLIAQWNGRGLVLTDGAVDQAGRLVVLGLAMSSAGFTDRNAFIARILPNGELDVTFGDAGFVVEPDGCEHNHLTVQSDGKIVVVGFQRLIDEQGVHYWRGYAIRYLSN
jgi:uncharacterized delta-60 repeat protein